MKKMQEQVNVKINNKVYPIPKGSTLEQIAQKIPQNKKYPILVAKVNNVLKELDYKINSNKVIEFSDLTESFGNRAHISGLVFVLIVAVKELYGTDADICVDHSLDKGLYIESTFPLDEAKVEIIKNKMKEMIEENRKIQKVIVDRMEAIKYFRQVKDDSKVGIMKYNTNTYITLYKLGDYYDYFYNKMPLTTGLLKDFELNYVNENGFMLRFPTIYKSDKIAEYVHHPKMFQVFHDCKQWNHLMQIENASSLNETVSQGTIDELIRICENKQNSEFLELAKKIVEKETAKIILMAGPSSSGKTTSSKKLCMALRSLGKKPSVISMDDYFVERIDTPLGEDGTPDYECLEAIDLKLFDEQVEKLLQGEKVLIPTYNFLTGKKEYKKELILEKEGILVIEGIHGLDNKILTNISKEDKYKIYVSALTELNIDSHNRVSTTDNRLLRRIVRDSKTRGHGVEETLSSWHSVRRGEEKHIFPYQDEADYILNTALLYELGVLKTYVEPLLYAVDTESFYYADAKRLIDFLRNFLPIPADAIPQDSILREFIGGSCFKEE